MNIFWILWINIKNLFCIIMRNFIYFKKLKYYKNRVIICIYIDGLNINMIILVIKVKDFLFKEKQLEREYNV